MDRLDAMAVFVAIVDHGSFSEAARALGRSPASITRAVASLEERLGQRLLHRSTRRLRLTELGAHHLEIYRRVLADLAEADQTPGDAQALSGTVRVTAPDMFGRLRVLPAAEDFLRAHGAVRLRLLLVNRVVNLTEEGIDLAIRLAPLASSSLIALRLGEMRRLTCASPSYLARQGTPERPEDLARHACIDTENRERAPWRFAEGGVPVTVAVEPRIGLNNAAAAIDAAVRGQGVCRPFSYQVAEEVKAGRLAVILAPFEPRPLPVHLVFHPVPPRNLALRRFIDFLAPRLREELAALTASLG